MTLKKEFQDRYNKLLGRNNKAEKYFLDYHGSVENVKLLNEFNKIAKGLSLMQKEHLDKFKTEMTENEILNGFYFK